jgi:hypothetical protein
VEIGRELIQWRVEIGRELIYREHVTPSSQHTLSSFHLVGNKGIDISLILPHEMPYQT